MTNFKNAYVLGALHMLAWGLSLVVQAAPKERIETLSRNAHRQIIEDFKNLDKENLCPEGARRDQESRLLMAAQRLALLADAAKNERGLAYDENDKPLSSPKASAYSDAATVFLAMGWQIHHQIKHPMETSRAYGKLLNSIPGVKAIPGLTKSDTSRLAIFRSLAGNSCVDLISVVNGSVKTATQLGFGAVMAVEGAMIVLLFKAKNAMLYGDDRERFKHDQDDLREISRLSEEATQAKDTDAFLRVAAEMELKMKETIEIIEKGLPARTSLYGQDRAYLTQSLYWLSAAKADYYYDSLSVHMQVLADHRAACVAPASH